MDSTPLALKAAQILYDRKALDILALSVGHLTIIADCLVIASGRSALQVKTLANDVEDRLAAENIRPRRIEGHHEGRWIVMDYQTMILHLFHPEERAYYHLERLWEDGSNRLTLPFSQEDETSSI
jgi:ribosome-associated protein